MMNFNYFNPSNLSVFKDTVQKLAGYALVAGGTDLLVKMKEKIISPPNLIDLSNLVELKGIRLSDGGYLDIGAMTTHVELVNSALVKKHARILAQAASQIGSPQIRNMGTVGGNIGNASPAADTAPALLVLDAKVNVDGITGCEEKDLYQIFKSPGSLKLRHGQVITKFKICTIKENEGAAFIKLGKRKALAISVLNCAVWLKVSQGHIANVRIALGSVAPTPLRLFEVEDWLLGKKIQTEVLETAARMAKDIIKPIDDIRSTAEYRKSIAEVTVLRGLKIALQEAQEECGNE
ncbi:MAG: FAD binding domain-containing protein [Peptococcaceae bacterium]